MKRNVFEDILEKLGNIISDVKMEYEEGKQFEIIQAKLDMILEKMFPEKFKEGQQPAETGKEEEPEAAEHPPIRKRR